VNFKPRTIRTTLAAAVVGLLCTQAQAFNDYFLRIDGIAGESVDERHAGQIEVQSWSAGAAPPAAASGKAKGACVKDISFVKSLDKASPLLLANAISGMTIPTATLVAVKQVGSANGAPAEYLRIELKDVVVTSVQDGGSSGSAPLEQVTLSFGSLNLQYKPQKNDGSLGDVIQTTVKGGC
jgi:type VI secretion system secreted protein Hcp